MEHSPSSEAKHFQLLKKFSAFYEKYCFHQSPTQSFLSQQKPMHIYSPYVETYFNIILHLHSGLARNYFLQHFSPKPMCIVYIFKLRCATCCVAVSICELITVTLLRIANYEEILYKSFPLFLILRPYQVQIFSSTLYSQNTCLVSFH